MIFIVSLLSLPGCAQNIAVSNFCLIYKPIMHSAKDTEETLRQIDFNNLAYDELCSD